MASSIPSTDFELMRRVAENDPKALEILYNRYSPLLYSMIKKIVDNEEEAGHILSDVFIIVWKKINHFDFNTKNVYAWIVNLARNKAVDHKKRKKDPDAYELYSDEYEERCIIPLLSPEIDPLDLTTVGSIRSGVDNAFNKLTDAQQYVIQLAYYEGLSEQEIAKNLNIPLPTVKAKIKMSLSGFRDYLIEGEE